MEFSLFDNLILGFSVAVTPQHLLYCFAGVFIGTHSRMLPGIGPAAAIAMLLPATFTLPPIASLIMLAGIYYGSQYAARRPRSWSRLPANPPRWSRV